MARRFKLPRLKRCLPAVESREIVNALVDSPA